MKLDINSLVNSVDPDQLAKKPADQDPHCFNTTCELVIINQNIKYGTEL